MPQPVISPWCFSFHFIFPRTIECVDVGTAEFGSLSSATALALPLMPVRICCILFPISFVPFGTLIISMSRLTFLPGQNVQVFVGKRPCLDSVIPTVASRFSALTQMHRFGYRLVSFFAVCLLRPVALRIWQLLLEVIRFNFYHLMIPTSSPPSAPDTSHTLENAIAYESPQVTAVAPKNSPMYGGFFVTLLGRHFGHVDTTVRYASQHRTL